MLIRGAIIRIIRSAKLCTERIKQVASISDRGREEVH